MKNFIDLIETVKREGLLLPGKTGESPPSRAAPGLVSEFFSFVEVCQPFVFSQTGGEIKNMDGLINDYCELDAPFRVFSIEMETGSICVPHPSDYPKLYIDCIMACEVRPKQFMYFALSRNETAGMKRVFVSKWWDHLAREYIDRINSERCGTENVRHRMKIGSGSTKRHVTINKVVHVRPKREAVGLTGEGRYVDWTHAWMVRGHWRRHQGTGKDRAGVYGVEGFTWVSEHVKGDVAKGFIAKTRVVE